MGKRKRAHINIQEEPDSETDVILETMVRTSGTSETTRRFRRKQSAPAPATQPATDTPSLSESVFANADEEKKRNQVSTFVAEHFE